MNDVRGCHSGQPHRGLTAWSRFSQKIKSYLRNSGADGNAPGPWPTTLIFTSWGAIAGWGCMILWNELLNGIDPMMISTGTIKRFDTLDGLTCNWNNK